MGAGRRGPSPELGRDPARAQSPPERAARTPTRARPSRAEDLRRGPSKENARDEDPGRIQVVVRKRPLSRKEAGCQDVLEIAGADVVVHEPKVKVDLTKFVERQRFCFDRAFGEATTNEELYAACVQPLVDHAFQGARCTCLAYGQTGSGKTHTLLGARRVPGMLTLCLDDVFRHLDRHPELSVRVSAYEIYCGKLFDLLNGRGTLCARENARQQVVIVGLREELARSRDQLLQVVEAGLASRKTGETAGNKESSRSHGVVQLRLVSQGGADFGKLSFVDLAGSERGADVGDFNKQTRIDGAEINKSLLALKECIRAMDQQKEHQPFRGSKLTQVLKDSLVGEDARTVLIAAVCPTSVQVEHTLNTLRYAWRVRELKSGGEARAAEKEDRVLRPLRESQDARAGSTGSALPDEETSFAPRIETEVGCVLHLPADEVMSLPEPAREPPVQSWSDVEELSAREPPRPREDTEAPLREEWDRRDEEEKRDMERREEERREREDRDRRENERRRIEEERRERERREEEERREKLDRERREEERRDEERRTEAARQQEAVQARHDALMAHLVDEEEAMIAAHRRHIDSMVTGLKQQMEALNEVDRPGSDVEQYVQSLVQGLKGQEARILELREQLRGFKRNLEEERLLSERARALQM